MPPIWCVNYLVTDVEIGTLIYTIYTQQKSSAQMGFRVNSVLARDSCIKYYISLFTEIILQHFDAFKIKIKGILAKLFKFKASSGHP